PAAIVYNAKAIEATNPPTKPPPGSWCPRSKMKMENSNKIGNKILVAVFKITEFIKCCVLGITMLYS
ncbi:hypothetical protein RZS08_52210, partial [Arthrospira platensis SPKY1]|nr:hypothetical protein [Arthrospira platensis SPKY1]